MYGITADRQTTPPAPNRSIDRRHRGRVIVPDRHGPYRKTRFIIEIDGIAKAGFSRCRLPDARSDVIEYREGTDPPTTRKLAGLNRVGNLVLTAGVTDDSITLAEWRESVEQGQVDEARRVAAVIILDEEGETGPRWELKNCWPVRYQPAELDARGEFVAIETLEIATEGIERVA